MENEKLKEWCINYVESEKAHRQQAIKLFDEWYKQIIKN